MTVENPFVVYSPEVITPKKFKDIFVKEYSWINALETPKDFFIHGTRGSGKSMLLNYLEFSHQLYYFDGDIKKFLEDENKRQKNIGIMVHVTRELLDTNRYELLIKNKMGVDEFVKELCMHDLIMSILYRLLKTIIETVPDYINAFDVEKIRDFCKKELEWLDGKQIHSLNFDSLHKPIEIIEKLASIFARERELIRYYTNERFQSIDATYKGNYSSFDYIHKFVINIKNVLGLEDYSFYILLDNADEAKNTIQLCINDLIFQREHLDVCFKIALKKGASWNLEKIQEPHDYSMIDIDELYSTQHTVYYKIIKEIATKRLEYAGIDATVEDLFPKSATEEKTLQELTIELKEKYEKEYEKKLLYENDNKGPSKSDYVNNRVSKYAQAELFRRLKKTGKSYAGFDNIVHLSSGIIRQFLDLCAKMFDEELKRNGDKDITQLSLKIQNDIIKNYADEFIDQLEEKYKGLKKENIPESLEEAKLYQGLFNLIEALGKLYKKRLMDPKLKEPRVFTFTLKDSSTDSEVEKILELGINENYFQSYWYSSKKGLGKYRGYAFNRRLCPRYGIDHTSFRGRIELSTADLKIAINTKKILKVFYDEEGEYPTLDLFN